MVVEKIVCNNFRCTSSNTRCCSHYYCNHRTDYKLIKCCTSIGNFLFIPTIILRFHFSRKIRDHISFLYSNRSNRTSLIVVGIYRHTDHRYAHKERQNARYKASEISLLFHRIYLRLKNKSHLPPLTLHRNHRAFLSRGSPLVYRIAEPYIFVNENY